MDIFAQWKWLWFAVAMVGFIVSGYFYLQAFQKLALGRRDEPLRPLAGVKPPAPPVVPAPPPAEPAQGNLLDALAGTDEEEDQTEAFAKSDDASPFPETDKTYGIDQGRTTRLTDQEPGTDPRDRKTEVMSGDAGTVDNAIRDAVADSMKDMLGVDEQDTLSDETDETEGTDDDAGDDGTTKKRRVATHTDIIRRAKRHEEIGLHIGIKGDQQEAETRLQTAQLDDILARLDQALNDESTVDAPADDVAQAHDSSALTKVVTGTTEVDDDTTTRLDQGEFKDGDTGYYEQANRSTATQLTPYTKQAPTISAGHDAAAAEPQEAPAEGDASPTAVEPTEAITKDNAGDEAYQKQGQRATLKGMQRYKSDEEKTADRIDDDTDDSALDQAKRATLPSDSADLPPTEAHSKPTQLVESERSRTVASAPAESADHAPTDAVADSAQGTDADSQGRAAAAAAAAALDEMFDKDSNQTPASSATVAADAAPEAEPNEAPAQADSADVPSWARADTFDEDQDDDEPKQQSLFD